MLNDLNEVSYLGQIIINLEWHVIEKFFRMQFVGFNQNIITLLHYYSDESNENVSDVAVLDINKRFSFQESAELILNEKTVKRTNAK